MSAYEKFNERWENEKSRGIEQGDIIRERMIYLCGWEDGIKNFIARPKEIKPPVADNKTEVRKHGKG